MRTCRSSGSHGAGAISITCGRRARRAALLRPLAIAVVGGFMVSAPLLLLVLPALLARGGTSASPTDEPAVVLQPAAPLADNRL